jgi:hypothetical protein
MVKPNPLEGKEVVFNTFFLTTYYKQGHKLIVRFYIDSVEAEIKIIGKANEVNKMLYTLMLRCRTHKDLYGYVLVTKLLKRAKAFEKKLKQS